MRKGQYKKFPDSPVEVFRLSDSPVEVFRLSDSPVDVFRLPSILGRFRAGTAVGVRVGASDVPIKGHGMSRGPRETSRFRIFFQSVI
jgi:hypothetical protein